MTSIAVKILCTNILSYIFTEICLTGGSFDFSDGLSEFTNGGKFDA